MNDMSSAIIPKSDQINADDLIAGPITITIAEVQIKGGQEQPVSIFFDGSEKAFRPCKSMSRVLVQGWGADASKYVGRSLTLYRDPEVKWGGLAVGGIRISHMTDLDGPKTMMLTATKGSRKPFKVLPLVKSATPGTGNHTAALEQLKALAQPGNMDALGAKWQEIGADARKALAAELPALKAACDAPAEDVPFDDRREDDKPDPSTNDAKPAGRTLAEQLEGPPTEQVDETTGEITDVHPGTAIADAIIDKLQDCIVIGAVDAVMAERATDIAAMLDEDGIRVEVAASKRRDAIEAAKAKAKGVDA